MKKLFFSIVAILLFSTYAQSQDFIDDPYVFDAKWYMDQNPDIVQNGFNTVELAREHFINHGIEEGRQSSRKFSVLYYRGAHPDLEIITSNITSTICNTVRMKGEKPLNSSVLKMEKPIPF